ncbi:LytR/AlgR family response regulator transcription factor [Enterococcus saccharolyticus]|uniref:Response regulator n=1 Tax=Enterococcus saccharolyticus subsp. saccharolyticus ATCC 43076 TaxID=1139996 RepID=S0P1J9_9ENTE|nr:LytTR family transcriptional regulator DNA-binding domain-containing protein [Enterococcus saccharolyticus]EOT25944.1 response regulator [Enterococcus saccharolyticus subsp. saccharolyticus ATCC 43076]EOT82688.1 response regulator [Enterococcus saccharolyticus subsp. saccharolyticus ATCC 43076]OJG91055.1 response regulator [Enterococcus saccharolyticus]
MHVLIVDDEPLAREELSYLVLQHPKITSTAEAESVEEAMEEMMDQKPDIVFLDIHLTDESGFDLAEKLTHLKKAPYLIFATAYDAYALQAFQVNAKDYLLKPFEEKKIHQALDKAIKELTPQQLAPKPKFEAIPIQGDDRIYLVAPEDIYLVSVEERQLNIETKDQTYHMTGTLNKIEQKLPSELFLKTHRSFILNRTKIQEIQPWFNHTLQVILENGSRVPVSRSYVKTFRAQVGLE